MKTLRCLLALSALLSLASAGRAATPTYNSFNTNQFYTNGSAPIVINLYTNFPSLVITNIYSSNIYVTNIYATNIFATNIYASNIVSGDLIWTNAGPWIAPLEFTNTTRIYPDGTFAFGDTNNSYFMGQFDTNSAIANLRLYNNGVLQFAINSSSGYSGTGTNFLNDAGDYVPGVGTLINPTDNFIPYRLDGATFDDSPMYRIDANTVGVDTVDANTLAATNLQSGGVIYSRSDGILTNVVNGTGFLFNDGSNTNLVWAGGAISDICLWTNKAGYLQPVNLALPVLWTNSIIVGARALSNSVFTGSTRDVHMIGEGNFQDSIVQNSHNLYALGNVALASSVLSNSYDILALGAAALYGAKITNSLEITAINEQSLLLSTITGSRDISALFDGSLKGSTIFNSQDITAIADFSLNDSVIGNSHDVTAIGNVSLGDSVITNSGAIMALNGALQNARITNSSGVTAIGQTAGDGLSGAYTNVILLGDGSLLGPSGMSNIVIGPSMSLVFNPGTTNVLYRSGTDLVYTNQSARFTVQGNDGAGYIGAGTGTFDVSSLTNDISIGNSTRTFHMAGPNIIPNFTDMTLGASGVPWESVWSKRDVIYGFLSGGDYSRLDISHSGTNGAIVFDSQSLGTAGAARGFTWASNGVTIASVAANSGYSGSGGNLLSDDGTYKSALSIAATQDPSIIITNILRDSLAGGVTNDLYTIPAGKRGRAIGSYNACALGGTATLFTYMKRAGTYYMLNANAVVTTNGMATTLANGSFVFDEGDTLSVSADQTLYFAIGLQLFPTNIAFRSVCNFSLAASTNLIYTCPPGKIATPINGFGGASPSSVTFAYSNISGGNRAIQRFLVPSGGTVGDQYKISGSLAVGSPSTSSISLPMLSAGDSAYLSTDAATSLQWAYLTVFEQ